MSCLIYYEHYYCSRNDVKIIRLNKLMKFHGLKHGYALYHMTLEVMLELDGYAIDVDDLDMVAVMVQESTETYRQFIDYAVEVGLFVKTNGKIFSERFTEWALRKSDIRSRNAENGKLGGRPKKQENIADSKDTHSAPDNPVNESFDAIELKSETITHTPKRVDHSHDVETVFSHWNGKQIIIHREVSADMRSAIVKAVSKYTVDGVLKAIDYYAHCLHDAGNIINYKWTLLEFLKRNNGIPIFHEKAVNIISTETAKSEAVKKVETEQKQQVEENNRLIAELDSHDWHEFETLEALLKHHRSYPDQDSQMRFRLTMPKRLQQIVTAPSCGVMRVLTDGVPETLKNEYEELRR